MATVGLPKFSRRPRVGVAYFYSRFLCIVVVSPLSVIFICGVACSLTSLLWLLVQLILAGVSWLLSVCPNSLVVQVSASPISTVVFSASSFPVVSPLSVIFNFGVACSLTLPLWFSVRLLLVGSSFMAAVSLHLSFMLFLLLS